MDFDTQSPQFLESPFYLDLSRQISEKMPIYESYCRRLLTDQDELVNEFVFAPSWGAFDGVMKNCPCVVESKNKQGVRKRKYDIEEKQFRDDLTKERTSQIAANKERLMQDEMNEKRRKLDQEEDEGLNEVEQNLDDLKRIKRTVIEQTRLGCVPASQFDPLDEIDVNETSDILSHDFSDGPIASDLTAETIDSTTETVSCSNPETAIESLREGLYNHTTTREDVDTLEDLCSQIKTQRQDEIERKRCALQEEVKQRMEFTEQEKDELFTLGKTPLFPVYHPDLTQLEIERREAQRKPSGPRIPSPQYTSTTLMYRVVLMVDPPTWPGDEEQPLSVYVNKRKRSSTSLIWDTVRRVVASLLKVEMRLAGVLMQVTKKISAKREEFLLRLSSEGDEVKEEAYLQHRRYCIRKRTGQIVE